MTRKVGSWIESQNRKKWTFGEKLVKIKLGLSYLMVFNQCECFDFGTCTIVM